MGKVFYHLFILLYQAGIRIASLWNPKATLWVQGRKQLPLVNPTPTNRIWIHCASLGEFEQGRPLIEKIKQQYPHNYIMLSFFSPSGYEVMKHYALADIVFYIPMDAKANAQQLINRLQPTLVIWVKYEFWYYYLTALKKRNIPVLLVSALFRPHQPFFKWYGGIWREMLTSFSHFFVQNAASKQLLGTLGFSSNVSLCGDTRFDRVIEIAENFNPLPLIAHFCNGQPVIVAGSTWEDDEAEWIHYVKNHPEIKFIIAPHEVDAGNIKAVQQVFTECILYSQLAQLPAESIAGMPHHVLIIDNIGMLSRLYHYADIAYVGGGFNAGGIHNVLEAAVYGKPVIHGPVYEKFSEAVGLVETGAGICINNALELEKVLNELWQDKTLLQQKSQAARQFVYMGAGATGAIVQFIQEKRLLTN